MTLALISLASFIGMSLVVWLPYWYSIPWWERKDIIEQWKWEREEKREERRERRSA